MHQDVFLYSKGCREYAEKDPCHLVLIELTALTKIFKECIVLGLN